MLKNRFILFLFFSFLSSMFFCYNRCYATKLCAYTYAYSFYCIEGSKECNDFVKLLKEYFLKDLGMNCWDKIPFEFDAKGDSYQEFNQNSFNYLSQLLNRYDAKVAFGSALSPDYILTCYNNEPIATK